MQQIVKSFSLSRDMKKSLMQYLTAREEFKCLAKANLFSSEVYQYLNKYNEDVCWVLYFMTRNDLVKMRIKRYLYQDRRIVLIITGQDCRACGVRSGKKMGEILNKVLSKKIDQGFKTRREELKVLRSLVVKS